MRKKRLGDVLRERGHIAADDLYKAVQEQQGKVLRLGELLLSRGLVTKQDLAAALEDVTRVPYVDCLTAEVAPHALELIPAATALRYCALPLGQQDGKLLVAMAEPQNLRILDELRFCAGMEIAPRMGFRPEIEAAIRKYYRSTPGDEAVQETLSIPETGDAPEIEFFTSSSRESAQEAMKEFQADLLHQRTPAVRLVSAIISAAANKSASDIHIEPQAAGTTVRIRVDGVLRELMQVTGKLRTTLVSRIKVLADMDIAERRAPQDGRFLVHIGSRKLDLRVSTLPTNFGEKVVMRLLESSAPLQSFAGLGLEPEVSEALTRVLALPQGMVLVTGPTGSGKTTTLYSALTLLRKPTVNIITVEDPIEYMLPGINQVQVNTKAGLTFSSCLRSMLRQDPNVIMVGEIRDSETAEIALKASLTGHMVLSTLHTNDSISAITRLLDLGIPAYLIASSLTGVMAQRLVRKLCPCRAEVRATPEYTARLLAAGIRDPKARMYTPVGCPQCDDTGYKGRVGVYEVLLLDEAIRNAIRSGGRTDEVRLLARSSGMSVIQEDAMEKVHQGLTTVDEVVRVVAFDTSVPERCRNCGKELGLAFLYCPYCATKRDAAAPAAERAIRTAGQIPVPQGGRS